MGDPHLGLGDPVADLAQASLKLGLLARAGAEPVRDVVGSGLAEHPSLERRGALAGRVASVGRRLAEGFERREQRRLHLEPARERILAAAAEQVLEPARDLGRAVGCLAHPAELGAALVLGAGADRAERALRLLQGLGDPLDPGFDRVIGRSAPVRGGELVGQRSERRAPTLDRPRELAAAARQRLRPHAEALVRGAHRCQPSPRLGALAVALGELLLDRGAALHHLGELGVDPGALLARGRGAPLGLRQVRLLPEQLGREQPGAELRRLTLEPGVDVGGLGLALQRPKPAARLALDVERPIEVVLGALELELGAAAALAVLAEAGSLLDQQAPVARGREDDLLDPPLADHRVHLAPQVRVGEGLDHVREPRPGAVDPVAALAPTLEPAADRNLGKPLPSPPSLSSTTSTSAWRLGPVPSPPA